mmetsp:Transcript_37209/g.48965  ORF Transcript_37209/g.48965 Transcript_37209/m.48965 type:complete len:161 (-) Transcript_37209:141-623(-)|eukprot:CAMPEP_0185576060 /NCGR_PEP_ID=MMETSP0434-20130131/7080_1 /TAXON_ID=626734 ORGANISM="Favella taraikaensis, Strain Fe Narragansett Bay" /NCGR_SAMPLE_ID=MMETSP0434 /ASSEMBLY_ACC=CAM_ASM_000379 /LENGTH=160 /DNA_ID=CAMNT_0028193127 /DNA_START=1074 /DNA_END=1556 /DNA_ORIENTATION=+
MYAIRGAIEQGKGDMDFAKTSVTVQQGVYQGSVDALGNFAIQVPGPGLYKVEVNNPKFYFEPVLVEIYADEFQEGKDSKAFLFSHKGKDYRLVYPLQLDPSSKYGYYEVKPPFNPWSYLQNPFVIMMGMTLLMSQLMKNVDPDEMKKAQSQQGDMMKDMP